MTKLIILSGLLLSASLGQIPDTTDSIYTAETDTVTTTPPIPLPELRSDKEPPAKLPEGEPFFDYEIKLDRLQVQMDSLKRVIKVYEKKQVLPQVNKALLDLIKMPEIQHRIILRNGTVIMGEITSESDERIILQTNIGRLVIDRDHVIRIEEEPPIQARVELIGEPFVNVYPDREEIAGAVKNAGNKRADFVRVIANLWASTTELAAVDSNFVNGVERKYNSGVITDTALDPNKTAKFRIIIPLSKEAKVAYRTYTINWEETN